MSSSTTVQNSLYSRLHKKNECDQISSFSKRLRFTNRVLHNFLILGSLKYKEFQTKIFYTYRSYYYLHLEMFSPFFWKFQNADFEFRKPSSLELGLQNTTLNVHHHIDVLFCGDLNSYKGQLSSDGAKLGPLPGRHGTVRVITELD